jgi:hypothetical protein
VYTRLEDEVRYVAVGGGVLDGEGRRGESSFLIGGNNRHVRFPFEALHKCCHEPLNPEALLARKKIYGLHFFPFPPFLPFSNT